MLRVLGTTFAALAGLAFGSFLNVCVTRWPQGESIVAPRSHCCSCGHSLTWWENLPAISWLILRGRCRTCCAWIGWRYPLVELSVGGLWAFTVWRFPGWNLVYGTLSSEPYPALIALLGQFVFYWLLVALAALDAEQLWLPDWLTLPGIVLGISFDLGRVYLSARTAAPGGLETAFLAVPHAALARTISIFFAAGLILLIRGIYRLMRRREGIGLGDAKLMAMLAAWLGFSRTLLAFGAGVMFATLFALSLLTLPAQRKSKDHWGAAKLPLGTFLCIGGIVAALWGYPIIAAYLHWAGFY